MSTITFPANTMCAAVNHTKGADCTSKGKYIALISIQGSNACLTNNPEGTAAPICGRHLNLLRADKSILLTNTYLNTIITKETTMSHENLDSTTLPQDGFTKCDPCTDANNEPHIPAEEQGTIYHREDESVVLVHPVPANEEGRKPGKGYVLCQKCTKLYQQPMYHVCIADIRTCSGITNPPQPIFPKNYHAKIDTNTRYGTRREAVLAQTKVKGGKIITNSDGTFSVVPVSHNS